MSFTKHLSISQLIISNYGVNDFSYYVTYNFLCFSLTENITVDLCIKRTSYADFLVIITG